MNYFERCVMQSWKDTAGWQNKYREQEGREGAGMNEEEQQQQQHRENSSSKVWLYWGMGR